MRVYASAGCTFSMSRLAMRLPIVARRSPAMRMPSAVAIATIVVPCRVVSAATGCATLRRPGNSSGAATPRKSVKEEVPALVNTAGIRPDGSEPAATAVLSTRLIGITYRMPMGHRSEPP